MEMFRNFGITLGLLRELRGASQTEIARRAGIGKGQLSKYERGKELPRLDSLGKVLAALGVSPLGFFYTLHLIDLRAKSLDLPDDNIPVTSVPDVGVLSGEISAAFGKVLADLFEVYQRMYSGALFGGSPQGSHGTDLPRR